MFLLCLDEALRKIVLVIDIVEPARDKRQEEPQAELVSLLPEKMVHGVELPCLPEEILDAAGDERKDYVHCNA